MKSSGFHVKSTTKCQMSQGPMVLFLYIQLNGLLDPQNRLHGKSPIIYNLSFTKHLGFNVLCCFQ